MQGYIHRKINLTEFVDDICIRGFKHDNNKLRGRQQPTGESRAESEGFDFILARAYL